MWQGAEILNIIREKGVDCIDFCLRESYAEGMSRSTKGGSRIADASRVNYGKACAVPHSRLSHQLQPYPHTRSVRISLLRASKTQKDALVLTSNQSSYTLMLEIAEICGACADDSDS